MQSIRGDDEGRIDDELELVKRWPDGGAPLLDVNLTLAGTPEDDLLRFPATRLLLLTLVSDSSSKACYHWIQCKPIPIYHAHTAVTGSELMVDG